MRKTVQRLQSPPTPDPSLFPANTNAPPPPPPPTPPSNTPRETIMRKTNLTSTPENKKKKKRKKTSSSRDTTHIIVIIDLHHGSINAGAQTFHFNQCKHAILRRLTTFNTWAENTTHELWSNITYCRHSVNTHPDIQSLYPPSLHDPMKATAVTTEDWSRTY